MSIKEKAIENHAQGCNCAQSVLLALSEYTHLSEDTAKKIAEGFGGGVRSGEICGSISGGVMALGLALDSPIADATRQFVGTFAKKEGCVRCQELLAKYGGKGNCNAFIGFCAEEAEKMINNQ